MSLLKPTQKIKKEQLKLSLNKDVLSTLESYCHWAGFESKDDFIEQALCHIFKKDKEWVRHLQNSKTQD